METESSPSESFPSESAELLAGRRLILLSNREPYVKTKDKQGDERWMTRAGGLVTALEPVMRMSAGVWVAWDPHGELKETRRQQVPEKGPQFTLSQVPLSASEIRGYYYGFANGALWPLCHYSIDRSKFDEGEWHAYQRVNERFAEQLVTEAGPDDLIWIHDYHFCLVPAFVRQKRPVGGPLAFFLHIPFPSQEIFRVLPWRRQLLTGLLGADLVGFHTEGYVQAFLGCCERILGAQVDYAGGRVRWEGRTVHVGAFPIGIDVAEFERIGRADKTIKRSQDIRNNLRAERIVLGVDRLDYTKGIVERLHAIERLFEVKPEYLEKVSFVQVAVPSRTKVKEYSELKEELDRTVGRINGRFSRNEWAPIHYIYRGLEREELSAYYRAADVALITPLRDGMNLVAKEYCATHVEEDGALILSEFAGAAEYMANDAIIVNPFSTEDLCQAVDWALTMEPDERRRRMQNLRQAVAQTDIHRWLAGILGATFQRRETATPAPTPVPGRIAL